MLATAGIPSALFWLLFTECVILFLILVRGRL